MKKIVTFLLVIMAIQLGNAAETPGSFVCTNLAYRFGQVKYEHGKGLTVFDTNAKGKAAFKGIVADLWKVNSDQVEIGIVSVYMSDRSIKCKDFGSYLLNCKISPNSSQTNATIKVEGTVRLDSGLKNTFAINFEAPLESFELNTALAQKGVVVVGSKPTAVTFSSVDSVTKVKALINDQAVELEWNLSFKIKGEEASSFCTKLN